MPLTAASWAPFGSLLAAEGSAREANAGTAARHDYLTELVGTHPGGRWNVCVFRCSPPAQWPFTVRMLERHAHSTQIFSPMAARSYLLIVAEGGDTPDPATLRAFVAGPGQAIAYHPGTWHHPMIALGEVTDFLCLVHESGGHSDCEECGIDPVVVVAEPTSVTRR